MPGGHASHKGSANKPNTNANDIIASASDDTLDPKDILREEVTANAASRAEEFVDYPPALERPNEQTESKNQQK